MTAYTRNGNTLLSADYSCDGLRAWKAGADGKKTYFLYNGTQLLCELDANGAVTCYNVWGPTGLLSRIHPLTQQQTWYLFDALGNVAQRLDAAGMVKSTDQYDAWGNLLAGGDASDPFGYKGQAGYYTDHETGLVLCTHRYYDPMAGRWVTRDPMGYNGGQNIYSYCINYPTGLLDDNGTDNHHPYTIYGTWGDLNDFITAIYNMNNSNYTVGIPNGHCGPHGDDYNSQMSVALLRFDAFANGNNEVFSNWYYKLGSAIQNNPEGLGRSNFCGSNTQAAYNAVMKNFSQTTGATTPADPPAAPEVDGGYGGGEGGGGNCSSNNPYNFEAEHPNLTDEQRESLNSVLSSGVTGEELMSEEQAILQGN